MRIGDRPVSVTLDDTGILTVFSGSFPSDAHVFSDQQTDQIFAKLREAVPPDQDSSHVLVALRRDDALPRLKDLNLSYRFDKRAKRVEWRCEGDGEDDRSISTPPAIKEVVRSLYGTGKY